MSSVLILNQFGLIFIEVVLLLILLSNLRTLRRLGHYPVPAHWPRVSILVPARNEEHNIGPCLESLLAQQYPNFEVLALDDQSTDGTWQILSDLAADSRLKIFKGEPLPAGWLGKHWACHQLAHQADGELLLFTDADTRHAPSTLADSVAALLAERVALLTALPHEEVISWAEKLIVPLIPWSIFVFVPLNLAYRLRLPILSAAIGQFMLFKREAYDEIGGHAAVRLDVVDDLALGRRVKAHGLPWRLANGGSHVRCRMYRNFRQVYEGLSKNLFATFGYNVPFFLFVWTWLLIVFWKPLIILATASIGVPIAPLLLNQAIAAIVGALILWGLIHWRFRFPLYLTILYPITILLAFIIAIRSMILTLRGQTTWKERVLIKQKLS